MRTIRLEGITWQHRRAVDPLLGTLSAFRAQRPDIEVAWEARPLHGFEFQPVAELAERYDLIVLDHPFVGDIAASRCLLPLDALVDEELAGTFVGPSLEAYRYGGHIWALPVDAACQVAVYRPDVLGDAPVPRSWSEMLAIGERARARGIKLAIALKGVHGLMTFFTLCANLGRPCSSDPDEPLVDRETAAIVLDAMRRLLALCPREALDWNSIALHEAMAARDDLIYCPAVYCYATYAEADNAHPLRFADLAGFEGPLPAGSTIGGAGIGVSARVADRAAAFAYLRFLMQRATQRLFAFHHGQPARRDCWQDAEIDARFGGCYTNTIKTIELAWVRPRYRGYLAFQAEGGRLIEAHLRGAIGEPRLLDELARLHAQGRQGGRQS